ncbi:hypothetical protein E1B28_011800 [Marasmius oreades]|uniref:Uncharacterized protein n=1 Tax=Marasmius oreades TaxID=181124 RepID=A0A9P7URK7_9AGAR|nr:uncharacterized protein E1B28_011800 [Marasmius oreades]KAG7090196.1 hypothetical protein E1B28_011800 [Marasmius oreades]
MIKFAHSTQPNKSTDNLELRRAQHFLLSTSFSPPPSRNCSSVRFDQSLELKSHDDSQAHSAASSLTCPRHSRSSEEPVALDSNAQILTSLPRVGACCHPNRKKLICACMEGPFFRQKSNHRASKCSNNPALKSLTLPSSPCVWEATRSPILHVCPRRSRWPSHMYLHS